MKIPTPTDRALLAQVEQAGLPAPVAEHRFHPTRLWRFDFAWPEHRVAVEIEGGIWTQGGHTRGRGFRADMEKYNEAALHGWTVLRYTPKQIKNGAALEHLRRALGGGGLALHAGGR